MPHRQYLSLTDEDRLTVGSLLTTLKGANLLCNETEFEHFVNDCFFRGLCEYQKDVTRNDC